jgi:paraquat-inducible protein A
MQALSADNEHLVACHDCDLLQRLPTKAATGKVRCVRCGCVLHRLGRDAVAAPLALGLTALVLLLLSVSFPLLEFTLQGNRDATYLLAGIAELYGQGRPVLATVVMMTTLVAPVLHILLLIHIYLPLAMGRRPLAFPMALRLAQRVIPWSMLEIFLLGVLVAAVKLAGEATIVPGPAAWTLAALVVALAAASTQVHPHRLWALIR